VPRSRYATAKALEFYLDKILLMAESPQQRTLEVDNGFASTIPGVHP